MTKYKGRVARDLVAAAISGRILVQCGVDPSFIEGDKTFATAFSRIGSLRDKCPYVATYTCRISARTQNEARGPSHD
jgi:hypothetical protein